MDKMKGNMVLHYFYIMHSGSEDFYSRPEMHRWHHSTGKGRNRNFATKLAIWDWIFGTAFLPETKPDEYGLKTYFPNHYLMQTFFAFRPFKRSPQTSTTNLET